MKVLVIGAGLTGLCMANLLADKHEVTVMEKSNKIGGLCRDEHLNGVLIHPYGPHYFRTNNKKAFDYINKFTRIEETKDYKVLSCIGGEYFPIPINMNTINKFFKVNLKTENEVESFLKLISIKKGKPKNSEDIVVSKVGRLIYENFFKEYTKKQWGLDPSELEPEVCSRVPIRYNNNDCYFDRKYMGLPRYSWSMAFEAMTAHKNINIQLNKPFITDHIAFYKDKYDIIIYTGPIDYYFDYNLGKLPYRSLMFEKIECPIAYSQQEVQINHADERVPYTRVVELKHISGQKCSNTVLVREIPSDMGEPMYPIPTKANYDLASRYKKDTKKEKNVYFIGRLAEYAYIDMDQIIERCLKLASKIN